MCVFVYACIYMCVFVYMYIYIYIYIYSGTCKIRKELLKTCSFLKCTKYLKIILKKWSLCFIYVSSENFIPLN